MIFWWFERTVTVTGREARDTRCEFCRALFRHVVTVVKERTAEGLLPSSDERVSAMQKAAESEMPESLAKSPGRTPCAYCYAYQQAMFPKMALKYYEWTISVAGIAFFAAVGSFMGVGMAFSKKDDPNPNPFRVLLFLIPIAFVLLGIAIIWARQRLLARFDPNRLEPIWDRKHSAGQGAVLLEPGDIPQPVMAEQ